MRFIATDKEVVVQHLNHSLQHIREELTGTEGKLLLQLKKKSASYHSLNLFLFLAKAPERTSLKRLILKRP